MSVDADAYTGTEHRAASSDEDAGQKPREERGELPALEAAEFPAHESLSFRTKHQALSTRHLPHASDGLHRLEGGVHPALAAGERGRAPVVNRRALDLGTPRSRPLRGAFGGGYASRSSTCTVIVFVFAAIWVSPFVRVTDVSPDSPDSPDCEITTKRKVR